MKETVLRVIHSPFFKAKDDVINAQSRRDKHVIFHCQLDIQEQTLVQEEIESNRVLSVRVKHLTNPPPELNLEAYLSVSKLELSCPVDIPWVFSMSSSLPALTLIRFGSSSFTENSPFRDCKILDNRNSLSKSPQVKELVISFNYNVKLTKDQSNRLMDVMDSILELSAFFLTGLMKSNLTLPLGVNIDGFLERFPSMRSKGDKREMFNKGYVTFTSQSTTNTIAKSSPPPKPRSHSSSGSGRSRSPHQRKEEKSSRRKDERQPIKKHSQLREEYKAMYEKVEAPCTSTTRSPRSDLSSEVFVADYHHSQKISIGSNLTRLESRPRSPSILMNFDQMFTRR